MMSCRLFAILTLAISSAIWLIPEENPVQIKMGHSLEIGRDNLLFGSIASVCEDDQANFYVLDRMECKIFKFSPEGSSLLSFGQKGQGPGDFQAPSQIIFTSQGELAILEDLYYVSFHKTDGSFIRRLDLNGRLGPEYIGPDCFYSWIWRPDDQQQVMVDARNKVLRTLHTIAREKFMTTLPDESGRLVMFNYSHDAYVPGFLFAHSGDLSAVGISDRYEIELLDKAGQTVGTVKRDLNPQKFSAKEKDYLEEGVRDFAKSKGWPDRVARELVKKIPPSKNPIKDIRISPEYVFVFGFPADISDQDGQLPVDIFSRKGEFMGTAQAGEVPLFISEKAMYFSRSDDAGNIFLVRRGYSILF